MGERERERERVFLNFLNRCFLIVLMHARTSHSRFPPAQRNREEWREGENTVVVDWVKTCSSCFSLPIQRKEGRSREEGEKVGGSWDNEERGSWDNEEREAVSM